MTTNAPITVAYGDGIGPEIMKASLKIMQEAGAQLDIETIEIGEQVYLRGNTSGIESGAWDSLRRTKVLYKAPITTPQGGGYKSLNVTIRKTMGLFANVRPCESFFPFIETKHPLMDTVIIRENEEDLYAGIEHRQTAEVYQTLKLVSRPGTEKIIRYAFEYARRNNRKKVTAFTKDNIMKFTDGLFHKVFREIAAEYPEIEHEHWIIDIGAAKLADRPEQFDVIVSLNLYGDIISDVTAQLTGSVGLGASANIGQHMAMFEAIHGSAPDIAGRGIANPSGLLLAGVMMLVHLGQPEVAEKIHNAWYVTIEKGIHTGDIYNANISKEHVGTSEFTDAVIANLGKMPDTIKAVNYSAPEGDPISKSIELKSMPPSDKQLIGADVFIDWDEADRNPDTIGKNLAAAANGDGIELIMITNRGQKVYPDGAPETFCTDHWRCRFHRPDQSPITHQQLIGLLQRVTDGGFDFIKTEGLYTFDGVPGFSLGQGQ